MSTSTETSQFQNPFFSFKPSSRSPIVIAGRRANHPISIESLRSPMLLLKPNSRISTTSSTNIPPLIHVHEIDLFDKSHKHSDSLDMLCELSSLSTKQTPKFYNTLRKKQTASSSVFFRSGSNTLTNQVDGY
jgi:hypothetical protein